MSPTHSGDTMQIDFVPNRRINKSFKVKVDAIPHVHEGTKIWRRKNLPENCLSSLEILVVVE